MRFISPPIAHTQKASHGRIMRGTKPSAAPLSIPIIINQYRAFGKISIFSFKCPFKRRECLPDSTRHFIGEKNRSGFNSDAFA